MSNSKNLWKSVGHKLNPFKTGKEKTNKMIGGYCVTMIIFLFLTIMVLTAYSDGNQPDITPLPYSIVRASLLTFFTILEGLFGIYASLSIRIRRLEEDKEEQTKIPAKRNK